MNAPFAIPRRAAFMPLHRASRFGVREPQTMRTLKRRERRAPIPTGLRPPAQGCEARATLGHAPQLFSQPQRGCVTVPPSARCNPVGVDVILLRLPKVASRTRQPWAECFYPVGVKQPVMNCHRFGIPPNPRAKNPQSVTNCHRLKSEGRHVRQLVTNCDQLKTARRCVSQSVTNCYRLKSGCLSITQPVTNCNRLKIPLKPGNLIPPP